MDFGSAPLWGGRLAKLLMVILGDLSAGGEFGFDFNWGFI